MSFPSLLSDISKRRRPSVSLTGLMRWRHKGRSLFYCCLLALKLNVIDAWALFNTAPWMAGGQGVPFSFSSVLLLSLEFNSLDPLRIGKLVLQPDKCHCSGQPRPRPRPRTVLLCEPNSVTHVERATMPTDKNTAPSHTVPCLRGAATSEHQQGDKAWKAPHVQIEEDLQWVNNPN